jgi:Na+-transporting methylmalonyl-CoA/oxaloacetate decarboxylase gamma subunit
MGFLVVLAILLVVVFFVSEPLRRAARSPAREPGASDLAHATAIAELEATREAKLREILDADLDHRTGKLSDEDHRALDLTLRAEAIDILNQLDTLRGPDPEAGGDTGAWRNVAPPANADPGPDPVRTN